MCFKREFPQLRICSVSETIGVNWSIFRYAHRRNIVFSAAGNTVNSGRIVGGASRLGLRKCQQIECGDVCDHQHRDVDDRDRVGDAQLPRQRRKADLVAVVVVDDDVDRGDEIEGDDEQPKERTYAYGEKRHDCQHPGCKVTVGSEGGEASRQIGADDARNDEDEPEEAEAVQNSDGALRLDLVHRLEPGPHVRAEAKQPRDVTQDEMYLENGCRRHLASYQVLTDAASNTAVRMPSLPSMRFRPKLAKSCSKSGPITTPRFGEGGGPDARSWAIQALAASVSSCHASVRKPTGSIASRVAAAVRRKLVAGVRAQGTG